MKCVWVEDANIYEGSLISPTAKPIGGNIKSGTVLHIGRGVGKLLPCEGLEVRLKLNIVADFYHQRRGQIANLVMADRWEATLGAGESIINGKVCTTRALNMQCTCVCNGRAYVMDVRMITPLNWLTGLITVESGY